jgi:hypothetical protein
MLRGQGVTPVLVAVVLVVLSINPTTHAGLYDLNRHWANQMVCGGNVYDALLVQHDPNCYPQECNCFYKHCIETDCGVSFDPSSLGLAGSTTVFLAHYANSKCGGTILLGGGGDREVFGCVPEWPCVRQSRKPHTCRSVSYGLLSA